MTINTPVASVLKTITIACLLLSAHAGLLNNAVDRTAHQSDRIGFGVCNTLNSLSTLVSCEFATNGYIMNHLNPRLRLAEQHAEKLQKTVEVKEMLVVEIMTCTLNTTSAELALTQRVLTESQENLRNTQRDLALSN